MNLWFAANLDFWVFNSDLKLFERHRKKWTKKIKKKNRNFLREHKPFFKSKAQPEFRHCCWFIKLVQSVVGLSVGKVVVGPIDGIDVCGNWVGCEFVGIIVGLALGFNKTDSQAISYVFLFVHVNPS